MNIQPLLNVSLAEHQLHLALLFPAWPVEFGIPVTPTDQTARQRELQRLGCKLRELRHEAARLRNSRRNRAASSIEAELQTVINEILAIGPTA